MALALLSSLLNNSGYGFRTSNVVINHLFYMDVLKTFPKSDREQRGLLTIVKGISDDVKLEFGLEKCIKTTFERGKL